MQNAPIVRFRRYRALLWCLLVSLIFHFGVVPGLIGLLWGHRTMQPLEVVTVRVSSLQMQRRPKAQQPKPRHRVQPRSATVRPISQPQPAAAAPPERPELAKIEPRARINVPRVSSKSLDVNAQQAQFEKTIAQLREQSSPLSGISGERSAATPAPSKTYSFNVASSVGTAPQGYGVLTPVKAWQRDGYNYYYVRYYVEYADGTTETGYVPWPLRYAPADDPFARHWEHFPLPAPLPDFVLPADTNMHPLVAYCYEHRSELSNCPIAHD